MTGKLFSTTTTTEGNSMSKIEVSKELTESRAKFIDIQLARAATERLADDLDGNIAAPGVPAESAIRRAARKLLSGGAKEPELDVSSLRNELVKTRERLAILRDAEVLQGRAVDSLVSAESITASDSMSAEHTQAVRRVAEALQALLAANEAEQSIRERITTAGFNCYLTPMTVAVIGQPGDPYSTGNTWLADAAARGFVDAKTLPKNVRALIPLPPPKKIEVPRAKVDNDGWLAAG